MACGSKRRVSNCRDGSGRGNSGRDGSARDRSGPAPTDVTFQSGSAGAAGAATDAGGPASCRKYGVSDGDGAPSCNVSGSANVLTGIPSQAATDGATGSPPPAAVTGADRKSVSLGNGATGGGGCGSPGMPGIPAFGGAGSCPGIPEAPGSCAGAPGGAWKSALASRAIC